MSEERKKAVWPWIATVLIALPVLYVASIGPGYALITKTGARRSITAIWNRYCVPIQFVTERNETVHRAVNAYCRLCSHILWSIS